MSGGNSSPTRYLLSYNSIVHIMRVHPYYFVLVVCHVDLFFEGPIH